MKTVKTMKILHETIDLRDDYVDIHDLKFLKDNPRVYASTYGKKNFKNLPEEKQQEIILDELWKQPSVKNLIPEIKRHGGLMESILIRWDRKEVIEGNSRLAVYRKLYEESGQQDEWGFIPCDIIDTLTPRQQAVFLNQIHVKGKTQWSAYEKANFAYVRKEGGMPLADIAELFGESQQTIRIRVNTIKTMKENDDSKQSHFSHYDVLSRNPDIKKGMEKAAGWKNLLTDIKDFGNAPTFTAQELRNKMPIVLGKPKVLKKYVAREIDLDEAYQHAKISRVEDNIKKATALLNDVSSDKVKSLERNRFNAFVQTVKKLAREVKRIGDMTKSIGDKK